MEKGRSASLTGLDEDSKQLGIKNSTQLLICGLKVVSVEIIFIYIQTPKNIKTAMKHASGIYMPPSIALFLSQILSVSLTSKTINFC